MLEPPFPRTNAGRPALRRRSEFGMALATLLLAIGGAAVEAAQDAEAGLRTVVAPSGSSNPAGHPADAGAPDRARNGFERPGAAALASGEAGATAHAVDAAGHSSWTWQLGGSALLAALVAGFVRRRRPARNRGRAAHAPAVQGERRGAIDDVAATFTALHAVTGDSPARGVDAITGLPTREALAGVATALGRLALSTDIELCVLCLDLDDFRAVNERFGRAAGDTALRQVASRLRAAARDGDLVLRLGGDAFVVIAPCTAGSGDALTHGIAMRLLAQMQAPFTGIAPSNLRLGGCVGTARWRPGGPFLLESVAQAGEALLVAKRAGRCELRHYASRRGLRSRRTEARIS